jgi:hypothetical protein
MKKGANSSVDRKVVGSAAENESFNRHYNKELKVSEGILGLYLTIFRRDTYSTI